MFQQHKKQEEQQNKIFNIFKGKNLETEVYIQLRCIQGLSAGSDSKGSACDARDLGSIPGLGRSPGEGNGYPLQYSGLENPMGM